LNPQPSDRWSDALPVLNEDKNTQKNTKYTIRTHTHTKTENHLVYTMG